MASAPKNIVRFTPAQDTPDRLGLFTESFGPPEITKCGKIYWNFTRSDGGKFSLTSAYRESRNKPPA
jgi:hypothetical protein